MTPPQEAFLLRIMIGERDRLGETPLCEWLILKAHELQLAGATAVRGTMGIEGSDRLQSFKTVGFAADLPIAVEVVDKKHKLEAFLSVIENEIKGGVVTLEEVHVRRHGNGSVI